MGVRNGPVNDWKVPGGKRRSAAARKKALASIHTHVAVRPGPGEALRRISVAEFNRWVSEVHNRLEAE